MRVAAIDVGTNTTRLLVAETIASGYRDLDRRLVFTRLGEGVDAAGALLPEAIERTLRAIGDYCSICGDYGVDRMRVATTSAVRDAANRDEFLEAARVLSGADPQVLSGEDEARLSFAGAVSDLPPADYLVCDIGGGSTEFVLGSRDAGVRSSFSVDIGAVRLTERYLPSDPPAAEEIMSMESAIDDALHGADSVILVAAQTQFVGVAGTVTSLAAIKLALPRYDPARTHHLALSAGEVDRLYRLLGNMTEDERRRMPSLPEGRADVIVAGTAILQRSMINWGFPEVLVSEKDILDGLVLEMIESPTSE